jgi:hypothetical protein
LDKEQIGLSQPTQIIGTDNINVKKYFVAIGEVIHVWKILDYIINVHLGSLMLIQLPINKKW